MNIFILDTDPQKAAEYLCDKHVPKMLLETAQLLCSPFSDGEAPYKRTHYNHPCAKWARFTWGNYLWLLSYGLWIDKEFRLRYNKIHKSSKVFSWCITNAKKEMCMLRVPSVTEFAQCMPNEYKVKGNAVLAYRNYYHSKAFAKWQRGRSVPFWYHTCINNSWKDGHICKACAPTSAL